MNGRTETQLPSNHPLVVAWEKYKQTEDFERVRDQAEILHYSTSALWAAYYEGWMARREFEERQPLPKHWWQLWK